MTPELQIKVERAIRLLQSVAPIDGSPVEVAYSGGKDSDVILELTKMAGINYRAIYKNTTIDPPGTIKHCEENGVEIRNPQKNFFQIVAESGLPNRWHRICCSKLKEYKILDKNVMGVRKSESRKRAERYSEPTECRFYGSKKNHVEAIYPILDWSDKDVVDFIVERGIKVHPLYYREDGTIDPKRRLGCLGCPLASRKKRLEQLKEYPGFIRQYVKSIRKYRECQTEKRLNKGLTKEQIIESFGGTLDEYEYVALNVFCDNRREFEMKFTGLFGRTDCKAFLEETFNIKL